MFLILVFYVFNVQNPDFAPLRSTPRPSTQKPSYGIPVPEPVRSTEKPGYGGPDPVLPVRSTEKPGYGGPDPVPVRTTPAYGGPDILPIRSTEATATSSGTARPLYSSTTAAPPHTTAATPLQTTTEPINTGGGYGSGGSDETQVSNLHRYHLNYYCYRKTLT